LGAGPGPTKRYYVGLPKYEIMGEHLFGGNTPVDLPVKRLIDDAFNAAEPHINEIVQVALLGDRLDQGRGIEAGGVAVIWRRKK
jgi:hypothetical protein